MRCGPGKVSSHWRGKANLCTSGQCGQCFSRWPAKHRRMRMRSQRCARKAHVQMCIRRRTASHITWGSWEKSRIPAYTCRPLLQLIAVFRVTRAECILVVCPTFPFTKLHITHTLFCRPILAALSYKRNPEASRTWEKKIHISRSSRWCSIG